jgi:hypothetical protein
MKTILVLSLAFSWASSLLAQADPPQPNPEARIRLLIEQLKHDRFSERQAAIRALTQIDDALYPGCMSSRVRSLCRERGLSGCDCLRSRYGPGQFSGSGLNHSSCRPPGWGC